MISERTLKKWRKEALTILHGEYGQGSTGEVRIQFFDSQKKILKLTQELLDQHLLKK